VAESWLRYLRTLQGRQVSIALTDGTRIDDCQLMSAWYPARESIWVFSNGCDTFVPTEMVCNVWEGVPHQGDYQ
jgi:hypothetical protein